MREILGNKKGIRDSVLNELIALYDVQVPLGQLISAELALKLADITEFINREISLYISRSGQITNIVINAMISPKPLSLTSNLLIPITY